MLACMSVSGNNASDLSYAQFAFTKPRASICKAVYLLLERITVVNPEACVETAVDTALILIESEVQHLESLLTHAARSLRGAHAIGQTPLEQA